MNKSLSPTLVSQLNHNWRACLLNTKLMKCGCFLHLT